MSDTTNKESLTSSSYDYAEQAPVNHMGEKRRTSVVGVPAHQEHGPLVDHKIEADNAVRSNPDLTWSRIRYQLREPFSEFFGVFILILFGKDP